MTAMATTDHLDRPARPDLGECGALVWHEGMRWHVRITGSGPPIVLVHGTGASSESFDALARELAPHHTIVAPDLPGHALTETHRGFVPSLPNMAKALGRFLEELEIAPVVVAGHSAGAAVVAQMALDGFVSPSLVVGLGAALVPIPSTAAAVLRPMAKLLAFAPQVVSARIGTTSAVGQLLRGVGSGAEAERVERYRRLSARPSHVRATLAMMAEWDLGPLFSALPQLDAHVLLLAGRNDRAIALSQQRAAAARLRHAEIVVVEGAGHLFHEERPVETARAIERALSRISKGSA